MPMVLLNLNLLLKHISPSLLHHHNLQLKNWKLNCITYILRLRHVTFVKNKLLY